MLQATAGNSLTVSGNVTGGGPLLTGGAGRVVLSGAGSSVNDFGPQAAVTEVTGTVTSTNQFWNTYSGGTLTGTGTVNVNASGRFNVGGTLNPGTLTGPGVFHIGHVNLGGTLAVQLNGAAAGTQYDQVDVAGTVQVGGNLNVALGFLPALGDSFVVVNNDGADAVSGTFNNLAEGSLVTQSGGTFQVSYKGGTGNDVTLTLIDLNHAPELTAAQPGVGTTDENTAKTISLSSFINNGAGTTTVTDLDANTVLGGIALTGTTGAGTWYYSQDGVSFSAVGSVSNSQALLLGASAQLRYQPDAKNGETPTIIYRAWDKNSGIAGSKVDTSYNGIASPFSAATDTASLTVTPVNDAPTLSGGSSVGLGGTNEDTPSSATTISTLFGGVGYGDVDTGAVSGIAVIATVGNGTWQYSADGNTWTGFGSASGTNALLLSGSTQVRYVPDGKNGETASLTFRGWDQTSGTASTNASPSYANPGSGGGTSAFSSNSRSAQIVVTNVNDAPVAVDDTATTAEDTAKTFSRADLKGNDTDVDNTNAQLSVTAVSGATNGTVVLNSDGTATFTPTPNFNGTAGFDYTLSDGSLTDAGHVTIIVAAVNDAPVAVDDTATTAEDVAVAVDLRTLVTDVETPAAGLTFAVGGATNGTVVLQADGHTALFTPAADYTGPASFTYSVTDAGDGSSPPSTVGPVAVAVTVTPVNDPPVVRTNTGFTVPEGSTLVLSAAQLFADDADNTAAELIYTVTGVPAHGTLYRSGNPLYAGRTFTQQDVLDGRVSYVHDGGETTSDGFGFQLADGPAGTARVSVSSTGGQGNGTSAAPVLSADGRFVVFRSSATNLVPGDVNGVNDVFVTDRQTGVTTRVSVSSAGAQANGASNSPSVSADGRYVAYQSAATNLVPGDTNGRQDVFVTDRQTGQTTRVSVGPGSAQANFDALDPVISADGRYVAYRSRATNLVTGVTTAIEHVFVYDRQTGQTACASVSSTGEQADGPSGIQRVAISADGRYVAFRSDATNLVPDDTNLSSDIFVHDQVTGETTRVSVGAGGVESNGTSFGVALSADGRFVAFLSSANVLVPGDTNDVFDAFVYDRQTGETTRASVSSTGEQADLDTVNPFLSLSANGRFVAFESSATNLVPGDTNDSRDVFVHDRQTGRTVRASVNPAGADGDADSLQPALSADGRYLAYASAATNLVGGDANGTTDVFVTGIQPDVATVDGGVAITVTPVNDAPVAANDSYSTNEDVFILIPAPGVLGNDADADSTTLTAVLVNGPAHGFVNLNANGSFIYSPFPNYNGPDSFTYMASDGSLQSNVATVSLTVNPMNDPPVAKNDAYTVAEDGSINLPGPGVLGNDSDPDNPILTATRINGPSHGTLTLRADGGFTYTPAADYNGPDSFTYQASDGVLFSNPATVSITVTPVNDAPVAVNDSYSTNEDAILNIPAPGVLGNDSDADGGPLTAVLVSGPAHGTFTLNANGSFSYLPSPNYSGPDSFTYRASDGSATSNVATVSISVTPVNDAPTATGGTLSTNEDTPLTGTVTGGDPDGDALSFSVVTGPSHGTLSLGANGAFTYTPARDYNGPDAFTFKASDGSLSSIPATVNITVIPVPDGPAPTDDTATLAEDSPATPVDVLANDADPDNAGLHVSAVGIAGHGTVTLTGGTVRYTPARDYYGTDSFEYTVTDGAGHSATARVNVTVSPVADPPVAGDDTATASEDTADNVIPVLANDRDPDNLTGPANADLTVTGVTQPAHGSAAFTAAGVTYTPAPDFNGADSFTYTVTDPQGNTATATVSVTVTPQNDAPVARADAYATDEDTPLVVLTAAGVLANDTDADTDPLSVTLVSGPAHGALTLNADGSFTYTPTANFNGPDQFTYRVSDGTVSATATVSLTVRPVADAPVARGDDYETDEDTTLVIPAPGVLENDYDVDNLTGLANAGLHVTEFTQPAQGSVSLNEDRSFTYTPAEDFNGDDWFTYTITDAGGQTATGTVHVAVNPVSDAPVAVGDHYSVDEDGALEMSAPGVLANDTDGDNDALRAVLVSGPAHGSLTLNPDGSFTYTPAADYYGGDSFSYKAVDADGNESDTEVVSLTVSPVSDAPVANDDTLTVGEDDGPTAVPVLGNDTDADNLSGPANHDLEVVAVGGAAHGAVTITPDGEVIYKPNADYNGPDSFTYTVSDPEGNRSTATVTVTVTPGNDPPVVSDLSVSTAEDTPVSGQVTASDLDGDPLAFRVVAWPQHGSVVVHADGTFTYTPAGNYSGPDAFTVTANDGTADGNVATVSVTVTPVADAPAVTAASPGGAENAPIPVTITGAVTDTDGSESIAGYRIAGVPAGATFNHGADTGDGTWTFTPADLAGLTLTVPDGPATVHLTVTAVSREATGEAAEASVPLTVEVANVKPVTVIHGATTGTEGSPVALTATATDQSATDEAAGFTYGWVVTRSRNGGPFLPYAAGPGAAFTLDPDDDGVYRVTLVATDKDGTASDAVVQDVTVANARPTVTVTGQTPSPRQGFALAFGSAVADVGPADQAAGFTRAWTVTRYATATAAAGMPVNLAGVSTTGPGLTFVPTEPGYYVATLTATDKDAGATTASSARVNVVPGAGATLDGGRLIIVGTDGDDKIMVNPGSGNPEIKVKLNNDQQTFVGVTEIVVYANGGGDTVQVVGGITIPVVAFGGAGDDKISGGGGTNVLVGGAGDDLLVGGAARNVLIGGLGSDRLMGSGVDDLLVAGWTAFDANLAALAAVRAEWTSGRTFSQRVANLSGLTIAGADASAFAARANGDVFLRATGPGATAFDDGAVDYLTGGDGSDWLVYNRAGAGTRDQALDQSAFEAMFAEELELLGPYVGP